MSDNKVTLDQLDNSAVEAMSSSVGDVSMLNTENKTIVGAITEIVGKKEIANAIGEPLAETDKFTEMSSEINGLLSTFKTNMMNAGVVVESGDKFKNLIDKIKGLSGGEGNKGILYTKTNITISDTPITFETYSSNYENNQNYQQFLPATVSLDFNPTVYIVNFTSKKQFENGNYRLYEEFHIYDTTEPYEGVIWDYCYVSYGDFTSDDKIIRESSWSWNEYIKNNVENNMITFPIISSYEFSDGSLTTFDEVLYSVFYAIGVGEEDTTLRDSLASILQEEGVTVTEEDNMASLITKVDEEFDRKNANSSKGFNIKCVPSLPNTITNGEIYIIEPEYNHIYIDKKSTDDALIEYQFTENDIYVRLLDANSSTSYTTGIINDSITFNYIIGDIYKYISNTLIKCEEIYVGENNAWVSILDVPDELKLFYNGTFASELEGFDYVSLTQTGTSSTYTPSYEIGNYLRLKQSIPYTGQSSNRLISKKTIDLTGYDYLYLDLHTWSDSFTGTGIEEIIGKIRINDKNQNELKVLNVEYELIFNGKNYNYSKRYTTKIDLKGITGQCYITISGTLISEEGSYSSGIDIYQLTLGVE